MRKLSPVRHDLSERERLVERGAVVLRTNVSHPAMFWVTELAGLPLTAVMGDTSDITHQAWDYGKGRLLLAGGSELFRVDAAVSIKHLTAPFTVFDVLEYGEDLVVIHEIGALVVDGSTLAGKKSIPTDVLERWVLDGDVLTLSEMDGEGCMSIDLSEGREPIPAP